MPASSWVNCSHLYLPAEEAVLHFSWAGEHPVIIINWIKNAYLTQGQQVNRYFKTYLRCPKMRSYRFCLSILPVSNIMLHIQESVKKKKKSCLSIQTNSLRTLIILDESLKGVVLQRDGSLHLKNSHPPEVESGIHNHDSLLGLGWLLRLLIVWNDKVNGRFRLLEENSQLDLNLLGPEKWDIWGEKNAASA